MSETGPTDDQASPVQTETETVAAVAGKRPEVLEPVKRWWEFRNAVKGGPARRKKITNTSVRENLKPILRRMAKELFSAPYYFFLDNRRNLENHPA